MSCGGELDGSGHPLLVTCEYYGEMHVVNVTKETCMDELYAELCERWPEMDRASTRLQYEAPKDKMMVGLRRDEDILNMIRFHVVSKASICNVVATRFSVSEKQKR